MYFETCYSPCNCHLRSSSCFSIEFVLCLGFIIVGGKIGNIPNEIVLASAEVFNPKSRKSCSVRDLPDGRKVCRTSLVTMFSTLISRAPTRVGSH